ncbi:metallophosphoesterase [candidate division KSB1 bacterium]|nr:metallophosphoesterase [candidate division KSB1 bacterium]
MWKVKWLLLLGLAPALMHAGDQLRLGPYLQSVQPDRITVMWETTEATRGSVYWGIDSTQMRSRLTEPDLTTRHQVILQPLSPRTTYFYRCVWKDGSAPIGRFRTAPADAQTPIRIAVLGDSRTNPAMCQHISNLALKHDPDIVLHSGDLVTSGIKSEQWYPQLFEPAQNLMRNVPFYPVPGNHEEEAPYYYQYFPVHPNQSPWYAFDYGMVHIIALDTSVPTAPDSPQYQFLINDLKQNRNKPWLIALFHTPLFHCHPTRPVYDFRYAWQPLLMEYGVKLVLTGHDHYYHRSYPIGNMSEKQTGVIHITSAGSGAPLYPTVPTPYSAFHRSFFHFLILEINTGQIQMQAFNEADECFDAIVMSRHQEYPPADFVEYEMFRLEQDLLQALGKLKPSANALQETVFDTTLTLNTHFYLPVKGTFQWVSAQDWKIPVSVDSLHVAPEQPLRLPFKARVPTAKFLPAPILKLHLEADNSGRRVLGRAPFQAYLGFRNQDLTIPLEKAVFAAATQSKIPDPEALAMVLKYYADHPDASQVILNLANHFIKTHDPSIIKLIDTILQQDARPLNQFWFYPFYFFNQDFSKWNAWVAALQMLPASQKVAAPGLLYQLTKNEAFHTRWVRDWHILGPFPNTNDTGLSTVYSPEQTIDFDAEYAGKAQLPLKWRTVKITGRGLDFVKEFQTDSNPITEAVTYAYTTLWAQQAGEVLLLLGSDDGFVLWLNGIEVRRNPSARGAAPCQDVMYVRLRPGKNEILVKVAQGTGDWELMLQVADRGQILK